MKKYYLHDGISQQGPHDLYELKSKNILPDTPVWFDTLKGWTPAGRIDELKELFTSVPPPFNQPIPPLYDSFQSERTPNKKPLMVGGALTFVTVIIAIIYFSNNRSEAASPNLQVASSQIITDSIATVDPDKIRLQELEAKEKRRQAANEALTKKNMEYRNNWRKYVEPNTNRYRIDSWGGIYDLEIYATNNTDKIIDEVIVTIDYYKENGGLYTTKEVSITNIQPNSYGSAKVPNTNRGTRIETRISKITSRSLHFCYNSDYEGSFSQGISGNENDPWFCK